MPKFGLMTYKTPNVGDDIQSLAARQYLPSVDCLVDRDHMNAFNSPDDVTHMIMNGWYMAQPENWPPSRDLSPLFVAVHLSKHCRRELTKKDYFDYYKSHEPIGCRDHATVQAFQGMGIDAYYSGCLTLTLSAQEKPDRKKIVFCDPFGADKTYRFHKKGEPYFETLLDKMTDKPDDEAFEFVTHEIPQTLPAQDRYQLAETLLHKYANARCVVTCRIHCALPCLAFGTPVLFVIPRRGSDMMLGGLVGKLRWWFQKNRLSDQRFPGLVDLMHSIRIQDLENGSFGGFDLSNPPQNPKAIDQLQAALRERCETFIRNAA
ncbi:MAG: polysaccharide pyruvyl transferase family protein [Cohaesibacter sp.]|jgi:hypothetical protein|nr:polysaccharide pyruvyl transferase family protein [Cohaesibacter sp.]